MKKLTFFGLFLVMICHIAMAQHFIPFQGKVFDENNTPVSGTHNFRFIIDEPINQVTWIESHNNVEVFNGIYTLVLGSISPMDPDIFQSTVTHTIKVEMDEIEIDQVMIYKPIETDPTVDVSVKDGVSWDEVSGKPNVVLEGNETDPTVNASVKDGVSWEEIIDRPDNPVPIGTVLSFAGRKDKIPTDWLICDGSEQDRTTYAELYDILGDSWGDGNGTTTFNLPDLRGLFLRGVDDGAGRDPDVLVRGGGINNGNTGDNVGSVQDDDYKSHQHTLPMRVIGGIGNTSGGGNGVDTHPDRQPVAPSGGAETRPKNAYVFFIIKVQ